MQPQAIYNAVLTSFKVEVSAFKPGNVSIDSSGFGMVSDDFFRSAKLCTPILCEAELSTGERVLKSVRLTMDEVGCNTNLGMLLLFAPLVKAAEHLDSPNLKLFKRHIRAILSAVDRDETADFFTAIRTASPGGLGEVASHDVSKPPDCNLLQAMESVANRDMIARQYSEVFTDIFLGYEWLVEFMNRWQSIEWAAVATYLKFLSKFPDSHIVRKHGVEVAESVRAGTTAIMQAFINSATPEDMKGSLSVYDSELKAQGINPGTSADLTGASLLVYYLLTVNQT